MFQWFLKGDHATAFTCFGDSIALTELVTFDIAPEFAYGHIHDPVLGGIHGDHKRINIVFYVCPAFTFVQVFSGFQQPLFCVMVQKFIHIKINIVLNDNDTSQVVEYFRRNTFLIDKDLACLLVDLYVCILAA